MLKIVLFTILLLGNQNIVLFHEKLTFYLPKIVVLTFFHYFCKSKKNMYINLNGKLLALDTPIVMGIANYTEDSFYDGGQYSSKDALLERVALLLDEGADIIDLGALSTRPGAIEMDEKSEICKVKEALQLILSNFPGIAVSIDTWRASVAEMATGEGAAMINDISGGTFDEEMIPVIGKLKVPYCLTHTPAKPDKMQQNTNYESIISEMLYFFGVQIEKLKEAGVNDILIDPGFGFGKTLEQNYLLMNNLQAFSIFNLPVFVGISRKSMIYNLLGTTPREALNGTIALHAIALFKNAKVLRVHDVKAAKDTIRIIQALQASN